MGKKFSKTLAIIIIVLVVGGGGYFAYSKFGHKSTTTSAIKYSVAKVTKSNIDVTVQATGTVDGVDSVKIYSYNTGIIDGMTAKSGDAVKQGDLFCKIDDTSTKKEVDNAKLILEQRRLELTALQNDLDSLLVKAPIDGKVKSVFVGAGDDLSSIKDASVYGGMAIITSADGVLETNIPFKTGKVAEVYILPGQQIKKGDVLFKLDDTTIKNNIAQKENAIEQQENSLKEAQETLDKSEIATPISGILTTLNVKNGEIVTNEKQIATITDTSKMQVTIAVDELDINKVKVGQKATIKITDVDAKNFTGKVESISQSGTTSNNVTTYDVVVSIDNPDGVKIGMNATVTIAVQSKENVLTVPKEAVTEKNGKKYVTVSEAGVPSPGAANQSSNNGNGSKQVEIQTGISNKSVIEVVSGLTENQIILTRLPSTSSSSKNNMQGPPEMMGGMAGGMPGGK